MEPLHTLESPADRPWDRLFSSAAASLSHMPSPPDLSQTHLTTMQLEADALAVATSLDERTEERVASRSSLATSVSSTSSSASSASSTESVTY